MITLSAQWETVNIRAQKTVNTGAQTQETMSWKALGLYFATLAFLHGASL